MAVAALAAVSLVLPPRKPAAQRISTRPTSASVSDLISEADKDFQRGNVASAVDKYRQALEIDPGAPNLKSKLSRAEERLPGAAPKRPAAGDKKGAETGPLAWRPADLNDGQATPASILPPKLAGYKIIQNGWLKKPTMAGATYVPLSPSVAKQIDRILLTVGKFADAGGAEKLLSSEYATFPINQRDGRVNNHPAKFGLYNETRPQVFPILASLSWTRDKWFFSVQAAPLINRENGTQPSEAFKRGIMRDVAKKLGY